MMKKRTVNGRADRIIFEKSDSKRKYVVASIITVLVLAIVAVIIFIIYFQFAPCSSYPCYEKAISGCKRVIYINEEPEASWEYKIQGTKGDECEIDVKLLNAKKGELKLEDSIGFEMTCMYPIGQVIYPEKDLRNCHGRLKEEFQAITLERLHKIIVENLEDIGAELGPVEGF